MAGGRAVEQRRLRDRAQQRGQGARHRHGRALAPAPRSPQSRQRHRAFEQLHALRRYEQPGDERAQRLHDLEIYSIDEAFLGMGGFGASLESHARGLRAAVLQWTGIPVSVGIAPTKTLAKVANRLAKKDAAAGGVSRVISAATTIYRLFLVLAARARAQDAAGRQIAELALAGGVAFVSLEKLTPASACQGNGC